MILYVIFATSLLGILMAPFVSSRLSQFGRQEALQARELSFLCRHNFSQLLSL